MISLCKMQRYIIITLAVFLSPKTFAVVGCDACITQEVVAAQVTIQSAFSSLQTSMANTSQATETVNNTITQSSDALSAVLDTNQEYIKNVIEAESAKVGLQITKLTKVVQDTSKTFIDQIQEQLKANELAKQNMIYAFEYGAELAQPSSIMTARSRASAVKDALQEKTSTSITEKMKFKAWIKGNANNTSSVSHRLAFEKLSKNEDLFSRLSNTIITKDEGEKLLELLKYKLKPNPIKSDDLENTISKGPKAIKSAIKRLAAEQHLSVIHDIKVSNILDKMPLLSTSNWDSTYLKLKTDASGNTSLDEILEAETTRKLLSEEWYKELSMKSSTSALREQVFQAQIRSTLLDKLVEQEEKKILLMTMEKML